MMHLNDNDDQKLMKNIQNLSERPDSSVRKNKDLNRTCTDQ